MRSQAVHQKGLRIGEGDVPNEGRFGPLAAPREVQLVRSIGAKLVERVTDERVVVFWPWHVAQGGDVEGEDQDVVQVDGCVLKAEQGEVGAKHVVHRRDAMMHKQECRELDQREDCTGL